MLYRRQYNSLRSSLVEKCFFLLMSHLEQDSWVQISQFQSVAMYSYIPRETRPNLRSRQMGQPPRGIRNLRPLTHPMWYFTIKWRKYGHKQSFDVVEGLLSEMIGHWVIVGCWLLTGNWMEPAIIASNHDTESTAITITHTMSWPAIIA